MIFGKVISGRGVATGVTLLVICLLVIFPPTPSFEITEPKNGSDVNKDTIVSGHGAISGSSVSVYVDYKRESYLQQTVGTTQDGVWQCNAVIGHDGDAGKEYTIYATFTEDGKTYTTPPIIVIRSNN